MSVPVAYQGEPGAYSEAAVRSYFGESVEALACPSFERVFSAVAEGSARAGVVPIENSLAGSILENYDLLLAHDLMIVGEIGLAVRHCLLAPPGTRLETVRRAYSHPQALAQSLPWLNRHGIEPVAAFDTAGSAREVAERGEPGSAAVASARAGAIYGLDVLAEGIQTRQDNTTRFFVVAADAPAGRVSNKASLVFATANKPGALVSCLAVFSERGLNLTKLESRPTRSTRWEYHFYLDFEAASGAPLEANAIADLQNALDASTRFVRLLGLYAKAPEGPSDAT